MNTNQSIEKTVPYFDESHLSLPSPPLPSRHSGGAAASLVVEGATLLHPRHSHMLAPLTAVLLALGGEEPAAIARVVARSTGHQLRLRGGESPHGQGRDKDDDRGLHRDIVTKE